MSKNVIIILEDDPHQAESIENDLRASFPEHEIRICPTELEYRKLVDKISDRIAAVVLDAMVPWEFPNENMQIPPPEVQNGGMFKAGRRCLDFLRAKPHGQSVPVCVHTILDRGDAGFEESNKNVLFLSKRPQNGELTKNIYAMLHSCLRE